MWHNPQQVRFMLRQHVGVEVGRYPKALESVPDGGHKVHTDGLYHPISYSCS